MSTTSLPGYVSVTQAAIDYGVSRQRMHELVKRYGVVPKRAGPILLLSTSELRKIPRKRPNGVHISKRK